MWIDFRRDVCCVMLRDAAWCCVMLRGAAWCCVVRCVGLVALRHPVAMWFVFGLLGVLIMMCCVHQRGKRTGGEKEGLPCSSCAGH